MSLSNETREKVAEMLWSRFGPSHQIEWGRDESEADRAEYLGLADALLDAARSEGPADLKAVEIHESEVPEIIERGARGEALTVSEQAAWTGYELGWRDGRAEPSADLKAMREALTDGGPHVIADLLQQTAWLIDDPDFPNFAAADVTLPAGHWRALRRAAEVYAALNLSETVDE